MCQDAREYDDLRERIERREPGWENMQEVSAVYAMRPQMY